PCVGPYRLVIAIANIAPDRINVLVISFLASKLAVTGNPAVMRAGAGGMGMLAPTPRVVAASRGRPGWRSFALAPIPAGPRDLMTSVVRVVAAARRTRIKR